MQSVDKIMKPVAIDKPTGRVFAGAEVGLVLMDLSFNIIGCDRAAAAILDQPRGGLPHELLAVLSSRKSADLHALKVHLRRGKDEYVCRAHLIESFDGIRKPMIALHLEKDFSASDAAHELAARYSLTEREQEALRGILMGFSSKEVAERMNISPNTVKAFLRLIMIKMGVTRRAGIVAKILENRDAMPAIATIEQIRPRRVC